MNAKEIFQLAVRLLGLAFLYHGLMYAPLILVNFSFWSLLPNLIMTAWPLAVGKAMAAHTWPEDVVKNPQATLWTDGSVMLM